jgi:hypothetical protein
VRRLPFRPRCAAGRRHVPRPQRGNCCCLPPLLPGRHPPFGSAHARVPVSLTAAQRDDAAHAGLSPQGRAAGTRAWELIGNCRRRWGAAADLRATALPPPILPPSLPTFRVVRRRRWPRSPPCPAASSLTSHGSLECCQLYACGKPVVRGFTPHALVALLLPAC